jgi:hypothetical protein
MLGARRGQNLAKGRVEQADPRGVPGEVLLGERVDLEDPHVVVAQS